MELTNEIVEKYGFKRINNSTWRKGNWTLQNGHTHEGVTLYEKIMNTKKAYKLCIDGKFSQMITSEELLAELVRGREVDAGISKCNKHIVMPRFNDDYEEDKSEDEEPDGYECMSCGNIQFKHVGLSCNRCCGPLTEWYL